MSCDNGPNGAARSARTVARTRTCRSRPSSSPPARAPACGPSRPKPLHLICGRPMVMHVIHALEALDVDRTVVVVGHGAERVTKKVQEQAPGWANVAFVEQVEQRGTGHAVIVGLTAFPDDDLDDTSTVVVLPGDTPLLRVETIERLRRPPTRPRATAPRLLTARHGRPDRLRPGRAGQGRPGGPHRRAARRHARGARHRRGQHRHLRLPARPARAGAAPPLARQRPARVLPHRRHRRARRHGPPRRLGRRRGPGRDPGRQRPLAARPGRA